MARAPYTNTHLRLMQVIVWLLVGGNLALAAGVIYWKRNHNRVQLAPPQQIMGLELRLPAGWMNRSGVRSGTRFLVAAEQQGRGIGRTLELYRRSVGGGATSLEIIEEQVLGDAGDDEAQVSEAEPLAFGAGEGVIVEQHTIEHRLGAAPLRRIIVVAAMITDAGEVIVIKSSGGDDSSGRYLVEDVARSLKVLPNPTIKPDDDAI